MGDAATPTRRELLTTWTVAFAARLAVLVVAWTRFPPADDGVLYDTLARRVAHGLGYTWAWPDGVVTPVAHYPVGYPALLAVAYRLFGAHPASAMLMHALLGATGAVAVHVLAAAGTSRRAGRWAGLAVAFQPDLLAYTPAIMTEGVASALLAVPFALLVVKPASRMLTVLAGASLGLAVLVRPQLLALLPVAMWLVTRETPRWAAPALLVAGTLLLTLPWFVRNERAFGRPVLVSANGGWNLLIGTDARAGGGWRQLETPAPCKEVWGEVDKDVCFGREARARIAADPLGWLSLMPAKLATTFDLGGSGGSYLSRARPDLMPRWGLLLLGALGTLAERLALLVSLAWLAGAPGPRSRVRHGVALVSAPFLVVRHAWPAYVGLVALLALGGGRRLSTRPLEALTLAVVAATLATHALFFGAGRYALLVYPWVAALAAVAVASWRDERVARATHPVL